MRKQLDGSCKEHSREIYMQGKWNNLKIYKQHKYISRYMFKGISCECVKKRLKTKYKLVNVIQKYDIYEIKPCENNLEIDYFRLGKKRFQIRNKSRRKLFCVHNTVNVNLFSEEEKNSVKCKDRKLFVSNVKFL